MQEGQEARRQRCGDVKAKSGDGYHIPKKGSSSSSKGRKAKLHCHRCKEHGGAYTNHNTHDCEKYDKDGKLI